MVPDVDTVTPFMGVWIEIAGNTQVGNVNSVTPFMGVWIEIGVAITL